MHDQPERSSWTPENWLRTPISYFDDNTTHSSAQYYSSFQPTTEADSWVGAVPHTYFEKSENTGGWERQPDFRRQGDGNRYGTAPRVSEHPSRTRYDVDGNSRMGGTDGSSDPENREEQPDDIDPVRHSTAYTPSLSRLVLTSFWSTTGRAREIFEATRREEPAEFRRHVPGPWTGHIRSKAPSADVPGIQAWQ